MPILNKDIKKLYSRSAGRCNICSMNLIENDIQIGEMAHIIAKSSNGPRGIQDTIDNSYDNLILLCPTHHTIVDKNPEKYTTEVLRSIKDKYEKDISNRLDIDKEHLEDLSTLNTLFKYIPILDFRAMILELPNRISLDFTKVEMFDAFVVDNPHLFPFYDNELTNKWNIFLEKLNKIDDWVAGTLTKTNRLITLDEMLNSTSTEGGYNIYVHDDNGYLVLNKRFLSYEQIEIVNKNVSRLVQEFIYAHTDLIDYIRYNYRNIEWGRNGRG
ncbi:hypothetical protein AAX29_01739 [Aliarcobacter thereius]|uniref:HNH nuclease domain-containing protein n=1 Tax=Aliarcobacter thereius TaxID=544718 RepID=A0A1C0B5P6_9BACT|nr:HNH endonuclease signature motif containing protein [Aliarcobacter thereius]OCL98220.1 hypothetical protein AAX29_01739 [Aliarcobacter thereius]